MTYAPCIYRNANVKAREAVIDESGCQSLSALVDRDPNAWLNNFKCSCPAVVGEKPAFVKKSKCIGCPHAQGDGEPVPFVKRELPPCVHLGEEVRKAACSGCGGKLKVRVFACDVHAECVKTTSERGRLKAGIEDDLAKRKACDRCGDRTTAAAELPRTPSTP